MSLRPLRLDHDDPVGGSAAVHRQARRVLQDLDRLDVIRIDPAQTSICTGLDFLTIDDIERLGTTVRRLSASNTDDDSTIRRLRDVDAGDTAGEHFLDRLVGRGTDVLSAYC